jgi:hypothetical protein
VERPIDPDEPRAVWLTLADRSREVLVGAVTAAHEKHAELTSAIGGSGGERNRDLRDTLLTLLDDTPFADHTVPSESEHAMTTPRIVIGQDINVAGAATRAVVEALVAKAGTTF